MRLQKKKKHHKCLEQTYRILSAFIWMNMNGGFEWNYPKIQDDWQTMTVSVRTKGRPGLSLLRLPAQWWAPSPHRLLTSLFPESRWSTGKKQGGEEGVLELRINKWARRVLQWSEPGEPSNSTGRRGGEWGALRKRTGGKQRTLCNCHAGCSALCLALGAAGERERERGEAELHRHRVGRRDRGRHNR